MDKVVIYQSKRKALVITLLSGVFAVAGWLFLRYTDNHTAGWCLVILSGLCLIYGIGIWFDRHAYLVLTETGITEMSVVREEIEWDAIRRVGDLYFRGQFFVCLLVDKDYKPDLIPSTGFSRFNRLYASEGVKAVYIRPGILQINSARLIRIIESMMTADLGTRRELLHELLKDMR